MQCETCRRSIVQCEHRNDWMLPQIVVQCEQSSDPMTLKIVQCELCIRCRVKMSMLYLHNMDIFTLPEQGHFKFFKSESKDIYNATQDF